MNSERLQEILPTLKRYEGFLRDKYPYDTNNMSLFVSGEFVLLIEYGEDEDSAAVIHVPINAITQWIDEQENK